MGHVIPEMSAAHLVVKLRVLVLMITEFAVFVS
jgi:hypothetical protein